PTAVLSRDVMAISCFWPGWRTRVRIGGALPPLAKGPLVVEVLTTAPAGPVRVYISWVVEPETRTVTFCFDVLVSSRTRSTAGGATFPALAASRYFSAVIPCRSRTQADFRATSRTFNGAFC